MEKKTKIMIIGIDGGTFDIIRPLIQKGELSNIASLMRNGVSSDLISTVPPVTAPAWVSFMTGKNPGKHSIFHFFGHMHKHYTGKVLTANDIKTKTIWTLLSEVGKKIILVNVPMTYPPSPINGIMISGIGTPSEAKDFSYPQHIYQELLENIGDYIVDYWDEKVFKNPNPSPKLLDEMIVNLHYMTDKRTDAVLYLTSQYEWDLCMVVYVITDRFQHLFWRFMDKTHPAYDPKLAKIYNETIFDGYRKVDEAMGKILGQIGDDVTVIVMSDHGFGPLYKSFFINKWLAQKGLLKIKKTFPLTLQFTHPSLQRIFSRLRLNFVNKILPEKLIQKNIPRPRIIKKTWNNFIDWSQTKVYATDPLGLNINLKGREPQGIVNLGEEFENLLQFLKKELYKIKDSETGEPIVDGVFSKEEVYSGPHVDESRDLLYALKGLTYIPHPGLNSGGLFGRTENNWSGGHRFNGIFIMKSPLSKRGFSLTQSRIIDIAPTILYLFNHPISRDIDGCVLSEAFHPTVLENQPIEYIESREHKTIEIDKIISKDEEEQVRKHLSDLGYF